MSEQLNYYAKAIIAFIAPAAVVIGASVTEASAGGELITMGEWVTAMVAAIVTAAGVGIKANGPVPDGTGEHRAVG